MTALTPADVAHLQAGPAVTVSVSPVGVTNLTVTGVLWEALDSGGALFLQIDGRDLLPVFGRGEAHGCEPDGDFVTAFGALDPPGG